MNNWSDCSPNVIISQTLRFFKSLFDFLKMILTSRWNHLKRSQEWTVGMTTISRQTSLFVDGYFSSLWRNSLVSLCFSKWRSTIAYDNIPERQKGQGSPRLIFRLYCWCGDLCGLSCFAYHTAPPSTGRHCTVSVKTCLLLTWNRCVLRVYIASCFGNSVGFIFWYGVR